MLEDRGRLMSLWLIIARITDGVINLSGRESATALLNQTVHVGGVRIGNPSADKKKRKCLLCD